MITSDGEFIVQAANAIKLPTMFQDREVVEIGALASYGVSYYAIGRLLAFKVQRVLKGADPAVMPIEQLDRLEFVLNLKTAKSIGLAISRSVLDRANEVIQ